MPIANSEIRQLSFTVFGPAQPAGSKRAFVMKGTNRAIVTDANPKASVWKEQVAREAGIATGVGVHVLFCGPLSLEVLFVLPRPKAHYRTGKHAHELRPDAPHFHTKKPDATKLLRAVEDAMTGVVWRDDAQVAHQVVRKVYGHPVRCEITVREMPEGEQS